MKEHLVLMKMEHFKYLCNYPLKSVLSGKVLTLIILDNQDSTVRKLYF